MIDAGTLRSHPGGRPMSTLSDLLARLLGINPKPAPTPPPAPSPVPAPAPAGFRPQELVDAFNFERASRGMGLLRNDAALNRAAQEWADELARRGVLDHGNFMGRIHAVMTGPHAAAEDIATGQATVSKVVETWMRSPPHRANILAPNYGLCGVGRTVKDGRCWWVADFVQG
jgi:uncharacterized protein YkwD